MFEDLFAYIVIIVILCIIMIFSSNTIFQNEHEISYFYVTSKCKMKICVLNFFCITLFFL